MGRIEPLALAWSCDRLLRDWAIAPPSANHRVRSIHIPGLAAETGWAAVDRRALLQYRQSWRIAPIIRRVRLSSRGEDKGRLRDALDVPGDEGMGSE